MESEALAPLRQPGCGVLAVGQRVKFVRARPTSFAFRTLKAGEVYTVLRCRADHKANIWLRLAEMPGFSFRRTMFDAVA